MKLKSITEMLSDYTDIKNSYKLTLPVITILKIEETDVKKEGIAIYIVLSNGDTLSLYKDYMFINSKSKITSDYINSLTKHESNRVLAGLEMYETWLEDSRQNAKYK